MVAGIPKRTKLSQITPLHYVIGVGMLVIATMTYSLMFSSQITQRSSAQIYTAGEIIQEVAIGHLWFEEILSGDKNESIDGVWEHLDIATSHAHALLEGSEDPAVHQEIESVITSLEAFKTIGHKRRAEKQISSAGTDIDQQFDVVFKDLVKHAQSVRQTLLLSVDHNVRQYQATQFVLILLCLGLGGLIGLVLFRYEKRQNETLSFLQQSKDRLTEAQSIAQLGHYELDIQSGMWAASSELNSMSGLDDHQLKDIAGWSNIIHPDDSDRVTQYIQEDILGQKHEFNKEYRIINQKTDQCRWVHGLGKLTLDEHGNPITMLGTIQDITTRKQAEIQVSENESYYRGLFDNSPAAIWREDFSGVYAIFDELRAQGVQNLGAHLDKNPDTLLKMIKNVVILDVNQRSLDMHNADSKDQLINNLEKTFVDRSLDVFREEVIALWNGATTFESEAETQTLDGQPLNILLSLWINDETHGTDNHTAIITMIDITARKHAELQYRQAQKVESIGRLAGGVAHDLNNMLVPILGFSELLADELEPDDSRREFVSEINFAAIRARDLVRQLLAFSRKQTLEYRPVLVNDMLHNFKLLLRRTIREDIDLEYDLSPDVRAINADIGQFEQVIMNLVVNASDAMPDGGQIQVTTSCTTLMADQVKDLKPGDYAEISVRDSGIGMDSHTCKLIFEPFFTTKGECGTGLGLATVYGIIKQHMGHIQVSSSPEQGTTFTILLPITKKDTLPAPDTGTTLSTKSGMETILLVEDNPAVLQFTQAALSKLGYSLLTAEDGPRAMEIISSHQGPIDLLLTDVIMPKMNGKALFNFAVEQRPSLRVLYMSGYTGDVIDQHDVQSHGTAFIHKPFEIQALSAKIREALGVDATVEIGT